MVYVVIQRNREIQEKATEMGADAVAYGAAVKY
jgi:hypothetical protein